MQGDLPQKIAKLYNSSFLFRLHKDAKDKDKIRPIAVGGSLRCDYTLVLVNIILTYLPSSRPRINIPSASKAAPVLSTIQSAWR